MHKPDIESTDFPSRPYGQKDMIGFAAPPLDKVRIGIIGLGMRGPKAVERLCHIDGAEVVALCDLHEERVQKAQAILRQNGRPTAHGYYGDSEEWRKLVERDDLDLIYIVLKWQSHVRMATYAMQQGKHVAIEVPSAFEMEDIWKLIDTSERTRRHCMMLENCVYDAFELNTLNMAHHGLLGDILYAEGGYIHLLEDLWQQYDHNWRLEYNRMNRGDVYPTHGMGPACQILDIHRGDRLVKLVSMDSDPVSIPRLIEAKGEDPTGFRNGQHTYTMIRTMRGKTILIHHDVATPRPYSRQYNVAGTGGYATKYPLPMYALDRSSMTPSPALPDGCDQVSPHNWLSPEQQEALIEKYRHPLLRELGEQAARYDYRGGMNYIMDYRLIYCLRHGLPLDMDVYDLAEWCCVAPLSKQSIEGGSIPVDIPDFTRGAWDRIRGFRHAWVR